MDNSVFQSAIAYGYDSLGRLATADATGAITNSSDSSRTWGQSFVYDPFGNLLQQNVTRGSAPALSLYVDSSTNRIAMQSFAYDAAGNLTQTPSGATLSYDSENRLSQFSQSGRTRNYYNGVNGERLFDGTCWYLYGPDGYQARLSQDSGGSFVWQTDDMSLSGKQVVLQGRAILPDRVGSLLAYGVSAGPYSQMTPAASLYYPYGQAPDVIYSYSELYNFATYANDGNGLYYAKHRYYDFARGRFTTPDPSSSGKISDPLSWNRYAYVMGDPINKYDPTGLDSWDPSTNTVYGDLDPWVGSTSVSGSGGGGGGWGGVHLRAYIGVNDSGIVGGGASIGPAPSPTQSPSDSLIACQNGVLVGSIVQGIGTALGVGPKGSGDLNGDLAALVRDTVKDPGVGAQVAVSVASALRTLLTGPMAAKVGAILGADILPGIGVLATGYLVYEGILSANQYYKKTLRAVIKRISVNI